MPEPITTTLAAIATKEALGALVKPLISIAFKGVAAVSDSLVDSFSNKFVDYVDRQLEKHSFLNTLVFQNQILLEELYVPLTLVRTIDEGEEEEIKINKFNKQFIPDCKRVLVTDTAGMGKSTLMRYLLIQCIRSNFAIPVFIELRHLSQTQSVIALLERELNFTQHSTGVRFSQDNIAKLLSKGGIVFFFDGYDEISFKDREVVTKDVKGFIESYPSNYFALTSRAESGLSAFPSFAQFNIRPLKKPESFELIKKYDRGGPRSVRLIERLKGKELSSVHEFLQNPLLTTLLYRCFEYKQNVPEKKHIFYRQVFDALFDWHDSSKDGYNTREKKSRLDLDSFHRVLRVIGFISTLNGEIEGDKDVVLGWIRQAKQVCAGLIFSESDFLEDLTRAVPVFTRDGLYYKWSHKSLAEYFAAQYICTEGKDQQAEVFAHMLSAGILERFQNMLDQVYDLDLPAFRKHFIYPFAKAAYEYGNTSYKSIAPTVTVGDLELRRSVTFAGKITLLKGRVRLNEAIDHAALGQEPFPDDRNIHLTIFHPANLKSGILVLWVQNSMTVIASILSAKKDALMLDPLKVYGASKKMPVVGLPRKCVIKLTDDGACVLNSEKNFASVTRGLAESSPRMFVNIVACRKFCDTFSDEAAKEQFTKTLLSKILPAASV